MKSMKKLNYDQKLKYKRKQKLNLKLNFKFLIKRVVLFDKKKKTLIKKPKCNKFLEIKKHVNINIKYTIS